MGTHSGTNVAGEVQDGAAGGLGSSETSAPRLGEGPGVQRGAAEGAIADGEENEGANPTVPPLEAASPHRSRTRAEAPLEVPGTPQPGTPQPGSPGKVGASPAKGSAANRAAQALRHPREELSKPARWDTHSWLPLLPASGLLTLDSHDVLGFPIDPTKADRILKWSEGYMQTVAAQRTRWMAFLGTHSGVVDDAMRTRLKSLVRLGVPPELRHRVWRLTTGSFDKQRRANVTYDELLRRYQGVPSPFDDQIAKDLRRTLPSHPRYQNPDARRALARVLRAYALWHPDIGYCQGMNFLCGTLLLIMAEEDAFWLLAAIVEDVLPGFYHPSLIGVNADTNTLHDLVAIKLPHVALSLEAVGLDRDSLCSVYVAWFMCLFNQLPSESMLRVWDLLLFEGSKVLFRTSLALLLLNEKRLADLATAVEQGMIHVHSAGTEALEALRRMPLDAIDSNLLVTTAVHGLGSVPKALLQTLRLHSTRRVLSGGNIEEVFVKQSRPLLELRGKEDDNTRKTLLASNAGAYVWSGDDAGNVCVWDSQTGCIIKRNNTPSRRRVCSMAATRAGTSEVQSGDDPDDPDRVWGEHVWVGCQGGSICTFDTRTLELWGLLPGHTQDVMAMTRVGRHMWTAAGHVLLVWANCETSDPHVVQEIHLVGKDILSLHASRSGKFVFCGSIAGFVVLDAKTCATLAVGSVDEGVTDVVEVVRGGSDHFKDSQAAPGAARRGLKSQQHLRELGEGAGGKGGRDVEVWCIHGNSVIGCWDTETFSSGQCRHVGEGHVSGLAALPNGEVWSGSSDGRVCSWNSKNKRLIRKIGQVREPVSSMCPVANLLLGVLTVWVAHYDGSVSIWVSSELSQEDLRRAHLVRYEWRLRRENLAQIHTLTDESTGGNETGRGCEIS